MNQGVVVEKDDARPDVHVPARPEVGPEAGSGLQFDAPVESPLGARVENAYRSEKPRLMARVRAAGRTLEEAEDLLHDVYAEVMERVPLLPRIVNLPAWINTIFTRRLIDAWRHDRVRAASGETEVAEETVREIIAGVGLDPLDGYIRSCMVEALNDALRALPREQRRVVDAQVFGGMTFRDIAEETGESIDTLTARKRYAVGKL